MTLSELKTVIDSTGIPCAYRAFPKDDAPNLPFIVYFETQSNNFGADNKTYYEAKGVAVELYTKARDLVTEGKLENALSNVSQFWEKQIAFIDSELCYQISYEFEI